MMLQTRIGKEKMQALFITGPGEAVLGEIPAPRPTAGQVLLRTRIVGMCGSDMNTFRGKNPMVTYPRIPGHEIAATIHEVGPDVPPEFRAGMDVTVSPYTSCGACASCLRGRPNACKSNQTLGVQRDGGMAEFFLVPWQKLYIAEGLSLRELSLVEPLSVGFHASARGRVCASDAVLVLGCGAVGLGAISASAFAGARVIAADVDDEKLAIARQAGAAHLVHSQRQNLHEELAAITGGLGPDVVVEAIGLPETFRLAVEEVAFTGRVVYVGYAKDLVTYETKLFVQKELDILGSRNALDEFPTVIAMLQQKRFPVEKIISRTAKLTEAGDALRDWSDRPHAFTKILIDVGA
jgi:threonine dehydrogenase-like Zn-dependent dehydrogenase